MGEETVWKLKIGTVAAILLGVMGLMVGGMSMWVNNVSLKVNSHGEDIAMLKECQRNTSNTLMRIESIVDEIRQDQVSRARGR